MIKPNHNGERADARANRLRILDAAREVFAESGLAAEIKDIAERAHVGVGTIYRGFASKEALLEAAVEEGLEEADAIFAAAEASVDPLEGLRLFLARWLALIEEYGWLMKLYLNGQISVTDSPTFEALRYEERLQALIRRGVETGSYRPDLDAEMAALLVKGALLAWNYRRPGHKTREEVAEGLIALFSPARESRRRR